MDGVSTKDARRAFKDTIKIWERVMLKDTIGMLLLMAFGLAFFTHIVSSDLNFWALLVRFGGAG
jgi:hypothetical protein